MLKILLGIRLRELFAPLRSPKKRTRSILALIGLSLLALYLVAVFLFLFGAIFIGIGSSLSDAGQGWVYFSLAGVIASVLMFAGSIIFTQNQLYGAKDNEMLLAMPIRPLTILASRMLVLLVLNYLFEALVFLPALVIWPFVGAATLSGMLLAILTALVLPFPILAVSCFFGWLLAFVTARIRRKSLVTLVLSLAFFFAYFYLIDKVEGIVEWILAGASGLADSFRSIPPVYWLGRACIGGLGGLGYFLLVLALSALLAGLTYYWLCRTFLKTALHRTAAAAPRYREKELKRSGHLLALLKKELRHLISSSGYMMNAGIGLLFQLALPIVALVGGGELLGALRENVPGLMTPLAVLLSSALCAMVMFSASSVSLEGKNLWLVRVSPIPTKTVLQAKLAMHLVIALPVTLVSGILWAIAIRASFVDTLFLLLMPLLFTVFAALWGLTANLLFPKLEWINEMQPVKQGFSTFLAMFGTPLALTPGIGLAFLGMLIPIWIPLLLYTLLLGLACYGLYAWIGTRGVVRFEAL